MGAGDRDRATTRRERGDRLLPPPHGDAGLARPRTSSGLSAAIALDVITTSGRGGVEHVRRRVTDA